jgi:L,D-transpeptidase catalytic domain
MKKWLLFTGLAALVFLISSATWYLAKFKENPGAALNEKRIANTPGKKMVSTAAQAKLFTQANKFNASLCFLVDMKPESGANRFFVYDLENDSIRNQGLVTHGRCNKSWLTGREFGNTVGCGCTSLGKYKVGASYYGRFGLAYKLHGLDSTNSNAFKRFVVLHSHECVPAQEVAPYPICQSDGCPTVAPSFLKELQDILDKSSKPVLLWIYE